MKNKTRIFSKKGVKSGKRIRFLYATAFAVAYFFGISCQSGVFLAKSDSAIRERLASYTTYFNQNDGGRCENIRLAASRLNGIALQPYGELSFNAVVGARTAKNGYKQAKVIVQGEFVEGIGGGVCQVSTTLYNAALLSGLTVVESYAHSLQVGYVPPSRDAMVTSRNDLRLYNPRKETVYISSSVSAGSLRFTIYGKTNGRTYEIESREIEEIPPVEQLLAPGEEFLRLPRSGLKSESYLKTYEKGVLVSIRRLRTDEYAPQKGVIRKKSET